MTTSSDDDSDDSDDSWTVSHGHGKHRAHYAEHRPSTKQRVIVGDRPTISVSDAVPTASDEKKVCLLFIDSRLTVADLGAMI